MTGDKGPEGKGPAWATGCQCSNCLSFLEPHCLLGRSSSPKPGCEPRSGLLGRAPHCLALGSWSGSVLTCRIDQIFRSSGALPAILMWQAGNLGCSHTRAGASVMNKALVRRNVSSSGPRTGQKHHRKTSETSPTHKPTHLGPFHGGHQHGAGDKRPETFHKSIQL